MARGRSHLSEEAQWASSAHGAFCPENTAALNRKVGAQSAREPVTNATAVKPRVDKTKLRLRREQTVSGEASGEALLCLRSPTSC